MNVQRVIVCGVLLALLPLAARLPALGALALLAAVMVALITFEAVRFAEVRERVRHDEEVAVSSLAGRD